MIEDDDHPADDGPPLAANDNGNAEGRARVDAAVLRIARLIGRQMARERFERMIAANDNRPPERYDD